MSRRKQILGLGLLLAATTTVPALAQSSTSSQSQQLANDFPVCNKKATDADIELAKQKFIAARQDSEEGAYDMALRRFKDAYNLDCSKPELLLTVSATYERKPDKASALAALELYMQRVPKDTPDLGSVQNHIDNLKKEIAKAQPASTGSSGSQPNGDVQEHTIYPWLLVGAGVIAVGIGITVLVTAPALPGNCANSQCTRAPGENDTSLGKDRDDAGRHVGQTLGGVITIAGGGAMIVGGVVWHFLEPTGPKSTTGFLSPKNLTPSIAPGYGGFSYGAKF
jgi:hypothetical protein